MDVASSVLWVVLCGVAGYTAGILMTTEKFGVLDSIIVGITGSVLEGFSRCLVCGETSSVFGEYYEKFSCPLNMRNYNFINSKVIRIV